MGEEEGVEEEGRMRRSGLEDRKERDGKGEYRKEKEEGEREELTVGLSLGCSVGCYQEGS